VSIRMGLLAGLGTDRAREVAQAVHQAREACGGALVEGDPRAERIGSRQRPHTGIHHADISTRTSPRGHPHAGAARRRAPNLVLLDASCLFSSRSMTVSLTGRDPRGISVRSRRDPRWIPVRPLRGTPRHPLKPKPRPRQECNVRGSRFREVLQKFVTRTVVREISRITRRRAAAAPRGATHGLRCSTARVQRSADCVCGHSSESRTTVGARPIQRRPLDPPPPLSRGTSRGSPCNPRAAPSSQARAWRGRRRDPSR